MQAEYCFISLNLFNIYCTLVVLIYTDYLKTSYFICIFEVLHRHAALHRHASLFVYLKYYPTYLDIRWSFFSFRNNFKDLDPSYKMDLDLLDCLGPGCVAQSAGHLTRKSGVLGSIPGLATYFRFSFRFFKKGSCQLLAKVCARSTG